MSTLPECRHSLVICGRCANCGELQEQATGDQRKEGRMSELEGLARRWVSDWRQALSSLPHPDSHVGQEMTHGLVRLLKDAREEGRKEERERIALWHDVNEHANRQLAEAETRAGRQHNGQAAFVRAMAHADAAIAIRALAHPDGGKA